MVEEVSPDLLQKKAKRLADEQDRIDAENARVTETQRRRAAYEAFYEKWDGVLWYHGSDMHEKGREYNLRACEGLFLLQEMITLKHVVGFGVHGSTPMLEVLVNPGAERGEIGHLYEQIISYTPQGKKTTQYVADFDPTEFVGPQKAVVTALPARQWQLEVK